MRATAFYTLVIQNRVGADILGAFGLIVLALVALAAVGVLLVGVFGPARRHAREFEQPQDDGIEALRRRRMIVRGSRAQRRAPPNEVGRAAGAPPDRSSANL